MDEVIRLRVVDTGVGWHVSVERMGRTELGFLVPEAEVQTLRSRHHAALQTARTGRGILVRHQDAQVTERETAAGQVLAALLKGLSAEKGMPVLAVEAHSHPAQQLAWELLAGSATGPSLEANDAACLVRLLPGRPAERRPSAERLRIRTVMVSDTGADPVVQRVVSAVQQATELWGLPAPAETLSPEEGDLVVLHLVAHGQQTQSEQASELFSLVTRGEGAETLVARMPWLARVDLVVASICQAGRLAGVADLPTRLLAGGAAACVAPREAVRAEAVEAFIQGLYAALSQERDVLRAVVAGRRAVRGLGLPHPDARWHLFSLALSHLEWAAHPPRYVPTWRPTGWPTPAPDAAAALRDAAQLGAEVGYVGVEHIIAVLTDRPGLLPGQRVHIRPAPQVLARLRGLQHKEYSRIQVASPWLARLGSYLRPGFSLIELCAVILGHGRVHLAVLCGYSFDPLRPPLSDGDTQQGDTPIERLEVLFGPEGGHHLPFQAGAYIGRHHQDAPNDQPLYQGQPVTDTRLSRRELRWVEGGRLLHVKGDKPSEPFSFPGSPVQCFGHATWLMARRQGEVE